MKIRACDPDYVNVEYELRICRSLLNDDAASQSDFKRYTEPVIRLACDIYTSHPHKDINQWQIIIRQKINKALNASQMGIALQTADICWQRLMCK